jgi:hypothetical protein
MHPILTQALVADRVREWRDRAARDQLAKQARQARRTATLAANELPGPRSGSRWTRRQPVVAAAEAPVAVASGPSAAGDDRQSAGARAA